MRPVSSPDLGSSALKRRPLLINSRRYGDSAPIADIALSGELDQASANELDGVIRGAEEAAVALIVVDLSEVTFIDSAGLNLLLAAKRRSFGRLRYIPSCHDAVTRLLHLTGTLTMDD